ncbi:MAG: radical SAM protein, partial [Pseudonocardiaceae bacterium]
MRRTIRHTRNDGRDDWLRLIDDAAELGTQMIQFIGGEPTLHPALPELMDHALDSGLEVEVFTNLVRVTPRMWETFSRPRVRLATSFYADGVDQHEVITGRQGSYARTKANIAETVGQQWGGMAVRIRPVDAHGVIRIHGVILPKVIVIRTA